MLLEFWSSSKNLGPKCFQKNITKSLWPFPTSLNSTRADLVEVCKAQNAVLKDVHEDRPQFSKTGHSEHVHLFASQLCKSSKPRLQQEICIISLFSLNFESPTSLQSLQLCDRPPLTCVIIVCNSTS